MSARTEIEAALYAWLAPAVSPVVVIFADQDAPRPKPPYLTIKLVSSNIPNGGDAIHYLDDDTVVADGTRRATASVNAFGLVAIDALEAAINGLPLPRAQGVLTAAGLTVELASGISDITALIDTSREPRGVVDLALAYRQISASEDFVEAAAVAVEQVVETHTLTYTVDVTP